MANLTANTTNLAPATIKAPTEPFRKDLPATVLASLPRSDSSTILPASSQPSKSNSSTVASSPANSTKLPSSTVASPHSLLPKFDPSKITDKELITLCQQYGNNSKVWKRKFEELLPEVLKRRLYKKHNFVSIYEFAAKLCGMSRESVDNVLRIYRQFEDKPILKSLIVEYGWSKLRIVAGIATKETDSSWAEKVRVLPTSSLETIVRDFRRQEERKGIEKLISSQKLDNQNSTCPIFRAENLTEKTVVSANSPQTCKIVGRNVQLQPIAHCANQPNLSSESTSNCDNQFRHDSEYVSRLSNQLFPDPEHVSRLSNQFFPDSEHVSRLSNQLFPDSEHVSRLSNQLFPDPEHALQNISFKISNEIHFRLRKLKMRIEKGKKEKISFNQLFETMLNIIENKERIVKKRNNGCTIPALKTVKE